MINFGELYHVGKVIKIHGTIVDIEAIREKNSKHINFNGEILDNIKVFGNVVIKNGFDLLVAEILGEYTEDNDIAPRRIFTTQIIGRVDDKKYTSGVDKVAMVDNNVYLINENMKKLILTQNKDKVTLGKLLYNESMNSSFDINKLYASHIGVFGNTGSGKSYTLSKILETYFDKVSNDSNGKDKNFLIDLTGEYQEVQFIDVIQRYSINENTAIRPQIKLNLDSLSILLNATETTQKPLLKTAYNELIQSNRSINWIETLTTIILYGDEYLKQELIAMIPNDWSKQFIYDFSLINDFGTYKLYYKKKIIPGAIDTNKSNLENSLMNFILTEEVVCVDSTSRKWIDLFMQFNFDFLEKLYLKLLVKTSKYNNMEYVITLVQRFSKRKDEIKKYINFTEEEVLMDSERLVIYDLSALSDEYKKIVSTLLVFQKYSQRNKKEYFIKIIMDEAHNILSAVSHHDDNFSEYRINLFKKILKEGRKDNVFTYISSQRPSEIDETVVSQLHNFFVHNLKNSKDISLIEKAVPFISSNKIKIIPGLPKGTALFAGLGSEVSDVIKISKINNEKNIPDSHNVDIFDFLNKEASEDLSNSED